MYSFIHDMLALIVNLMVGLPYELAHLGNDLLIECRARVHRCLAFFEQGANGTLCGPSLGCELEDGFKVFIAVVYKMKETLVYYFP